MFLKESKYNEEKVIKYITDDLEIYSEDSNGTQIESKYGNV